MFNEKTFTVVGKEFEAGGDILTVRFSFSYDKVFYLMAEVVKMAESLRGIGIISQTEDGDDPVVLASGVYPELRDKRYYINGTDHSSDGPTAWVYTTAAERNRLMTIFANLVTEINEPLQPVITKLGNGDTQEVFGAHRLKVCFVYNDNNDTLAFSVLQQESSLRKHAVHADDGCYQIEAANSPEISRGGRQLYIRGDHSSQDDVTSRYTYDSHDQMLNAIAAFKRLISGINFPWLNKTEGVSV